MTRSELLAEPDFHTAPDWTRTLGDEVADLGSMIGFAPYPEQRLILDDVFALDPKRPDRSAAFEAAAIACRQQLKTGVLKLCALGWLFITDQPLVIWSAHEFGTSREAFRDIVALIDGSDYLSRRVSNITTAAGNEVIELTTGARLKFKARTSGGGRGLTGHKVILDEAFALMPEHMGALLPTLIAVPDPQVLYGSSAGMAKSEMLRQLRDRGRAGGGRLAYAEWLSEQRDCATDTCTHQPGTDGCALDDVDLWRQSCIVTARKDPAMAAIGALRAAMPAEEFMRECLGWWDEPLGSSTAFTAGRWERRVEHRPAGARVGALALAVSYDQSFGCISAAGRAAGRVHVKPLEHRPGVRWMVEQASLLQATHGVELAIDSKGPAASLIDDLLAAGVRLKILETAEVLDACAWIHRAVTEEPGRLAHGDYPELNRSVEGAVRRAVGDRWAWGRKASTSDVSPLESVTFAGWLADQRPDTAQPASSPEVTTTGGDGYDSHPIATAGF